MTKGKFITFEGPEGGGKSTQVAILKEKLYTYHEIRAISSRDPGGTQIGEEIRKILLGNFGEIAMADECELYLFQAARAQFVREVAKPSLEKGVWVLGDRFCDSSYAYQGYGRGINFEAIDFMTAFTTQGIIPDLTFLIDVPVSKGFERKKVLGKLDRIESASMNFHERIRLGYLQMAHKYPERIKIIYGTKPIEEVEQDIWKQTQKLIT